VIAWKTICRCSICSQSIRASRARAAHSRGTNCALRSWRTSSRGIEWAPGALVVPGQTIRARYPNNQSAAALWYHDRRQGFAIERVCRAVGLYLLRDDEERKAANPASDYEIPLILRDCTLDDHGQLVYATTFDDGQMPPPGRGAECLGELPLVNGALYPYLEVERAPIDSAW